MRNLLLSTAFTEITNQLKKHSFISNPYEEARMLIAHVANLSLEDFLTQSNEISLCIEQKLMLNHLVARREQGEPIAYIINNKEFFSRDFYVDKRVLIPRPETEILVEAVLSDYKKIEHPLSILELGVGSGCITITLLSLLTNAIAVVADISQDALNVCDKNAFLHKVSERIVCVQSDWFSNLISEAKFGKFDIIISNPPYINSGEEVITDYESIKFEPKLALFANNYINYKKIASGVTNFLKKEGALYIEIGKDTQGKIIPIYENMKCVDEYKDLAQIVRCLKFQFK
jgi:release factor glutamine methyltransferase